MCAAKYNKWVTAASNLCSPSACKWCDFMPHNIENLLLQLAVYNLARYVRTYMSSKIDRTYELATCKHH